MEKNKYYKNLAWYLPNLDREKTKSPVRVPLLNKPESVESTNVEMGDGYLAEIIQDFYYAEALKRTVNEGKETCNEEIERLNEMHENIIFLKRVLFGLFSSSEKIVLKHNTEQIIDENMWIKLSETLEELEEVECYFWMSKEDRIDRIIKLKLRLWDIIMNAAWALPDTKTKYLLHKLEQSYQNDDIEKTIMLFQKLVNEFRVRFFTKEDENNFSLICLRVFAYCLEISPDRYNRRNVESMVRDIDQKLGEWQYKVCCCLLSYSVNIYNQLKRENIHIRRFLWYLKCNESIRNLYLQEGKNKSCYSLVWAEGEQKQYFSLSGGSKKEQEYGQLLKGLIPEYWHYEQILLNNDVRYYYDPVNYVTYGQIKKANLKAGDEKKLISCCERKLLTRMNIPDRKYHMFIKWAPCEKCKRALANYDPENVIDIIAPKDKYYKKERSAIKECDDLVKMLNK